MNSSIQSVSPERKRRLTFTPRDRSPQVGTLDMSLEKGARSVRRGSAFSTNKDKMLHFGDFVQDIARKS